MFQVLPDKLSLTKYKSYCHTDFKPNKSTGHKKINKNGLQDTKQHIALLKQHIQHTYL